MSERSGVLVRGLSFEADGSVVSEYCIPGVDARSNGIVINHTMLIPAGDQYDDEIDAVRQAVIALINDVLEDLPFVEPVTFGDEDDDGNEDDDDDDDDDDSG